MTVTTYDKHITDMSKKHYISPLTEVISVTVETSLLQESFWTVQGLIGGDPNDKHKIEIVEGDPTDPNIRFAPSVSLWDDPEEEEDDKYHL